MPRQSLDDEWLEVVGTQGLVVITRDQRIRYRPVEKRMGVEHRVRGFVLTGTTNQSTTASLSLLENRWANIATIIDLNPVGPWMYGITEAGVRAIVLS